MNFNTYLSQFITERRKSLFDAVIEQRTNYLTVVLEDIYQAQNASAVIRSCDCFGIQNIHIIENKNEYAINPDVVKGASKWITLNRYREQENNTISTLQKLKGQGYRIVGTSPHIKEMTLESFDLNKGKAAIVFGTELTGISDEVHQEADEYLYIPMHGFTESLNISVSAAIILQQLSTSLRNTKLDWKLNEKERYDVLSKWLWKTVSTPDVHYKNYLNRYPENTLDL